MKGLLLVHNSDFREGKQTVLALLRAKVMAKVMGDVRLVSRKAFKSYTDRNNKIRDKTNRLNTKLLRMFALMKIMVKRKNRAVAC